VQVSVVTIGRFDTRRGWAPITWMKVWSSSLAGGAQAARRARRAIREALRDELPERRLGDVELLISELATNSVRHAGCDEAGELSVEADVREDCVRLLVCDDGEGFEGEDAEPHPDFDRGGGFGLMLVDELADRWGVRHNGGFCVWFEVARA
jgi:anti-sigma regulatory factor (Ser/Thr protein kinase)